MVLTRAVWGALCWMFTTNVCTLHTSPHQPVVVVAGLSPAECRLLWKEKWKELEKQDFGHLTYFIFVISASAIFNVVFPWDRILVTISLRTQDKKVTVTFCPSMSLDQISLDLGLSELPKLSFGKCHNNDWKNMSETYLLTLRLEVYIHSLSTCYQCLWTDWLDSKPK